MQASKNFAIPNLTIAKPFFDWLFCTEGLWQGENLYYQTAIPGTYFQSEILLEKGDFQQGESYTFLFISQKAVDDYYLLLKSKRPKEEAPYQLPFFMPTFYMELKSPEGYSFYFRFMHFRTSCDSVTDRPCQSCDTGCAISFGDEYPDISKEEILRRF